MAKLNDFIIDDFSGGLVTNKADHQMNKNEFKNTLNIDLDERGKAKRRMGIQQYGTTQSGTIDHSFIYRRITAGTYTQRRHLIIDRAASSTLYEVVGNYTTAAVATSDTTITVGSTGLFAASGTIEINGDLIAYTGLGGGGITFTGCSGILRAHPAFSAVNQIQSVGSLATDTRVGAYSAILGNLAFICGRAGTNNITFDGTTIAAVSDADAPAGVFATTYRNRIYVAGGNTANASGTRNGSPIRISFSDAGDATSWDLNNFFDVEDDNGEEISGLAVLNDNLLIFKPSSIFAYDEIQLKQTIRDVGAWSHRCIQKINGLLYTFGPTGVYVTNGLSATKISDPVQEYIKGFRPQFDTVIGRFVTNTFAGKYKDKYYLYIGNITEPETLSDVVLVYDTIRKNWTVYDGFTGFAHLGSFTSFNRGQEANSSAGGTTTQHGEALFAGDSSGRYFRLFESRFLDNQATRTQRGGDLIANLIANSTGNALSTVIETQYHFSGSASWKKFGMITAVVDQGDFMISYRLDQGKRETNWISLGNFQNGITTKKLRIESERGFNNNEGYRIALRITSNSADVIGKLNAVIIKDIESLDKKENFEYGTYG